MKKLISLLLVTALTLSISVPCFAQENSSDRHLEPSSSSVSVQNLGNGLTVETKTTVWRDALHLDSLSAVSQKNASWTKTYRNNGSVVATVTLNAAFGYNGFSAGVIRSSASHSTASGWSYEGESLSNSGNTASLTAVLQQWLGIIPVGTVNVDFSISCSPSGQII